MVEPAQEAHRAGLVRLAARRVLAHDVHRAQVAAVHRLEHLAQVPAFPAWKVGSAPRPRELVVDGRVLQVLEAGHPGGNGAHVTSALDVVLAAQRVQAAAVAAHLAGEQRKVDQSQHVVDGVVVLGDAERPADHPSLHARVLERRLLDR